MATNRKGDVELVVSAKNEATKTINELVQSLESLGKEAGASGIGGLFKKLAQSSEDLTRRQEELTNALNESRQAQKQLQQANDEREKDLQKQRDSIDKTQRSLDEMNAKYREYAAEATKARKPSDSLVKTYEKQQRRQAELAQSIDETGRKLSESQDRFNQNEGVDATASQNIEKYRKRVIELGEAWRDTTQAVAAAQQVLSQRAQVRDTADSGQREAQARLDTLREELQVARQYEKEQRRIVRESGEATDEQVQAKEQSIAATKRLRDAVADQVLVERQARESRNAATKSYNEQSREVDKLVGKADKQKAAYTELKAGLEDYRRAQEKASTERQRKEIDRLNASLEDLQDKYQSAATRFEKTQARMNKASGPDPRAVQRFENLQQRIKETEAEIVEQTAVLEKMQREYDDAGASADKLAQKERELEKVTDRLTDQQNELQQETNQTATATDRAGKEAAEAARRFRLWGEDSRQALSWLQRIRGELLSIAAAYGGVYAIGGAVRSIYEASVVTQRATARLAAKFNNDMSAVKDEMEFVREEADRLGLEFESLLDQYTKFINNVPDGTLTMDQIRYTFTGIAESSRAAGLGTQDVQAVFLALGQIASKGAVQLEELRQQLGERIPGASAAMAKGLTELTGAMVTTEELYERINRGELSANAIVALAKALKGEFGPSLKTALESPLPALNMLKNVIYDIRMEIADSGFIGELTDGLKRLNEQMQTPEFKTGLQKFANAMTGIAVFTGVLIENFDLVAVALTSWLAVGVGKFLTNMGRQIRNVTKVTKSGVTGFKNYGGAAKTLSVTINSLLRGLALLPAAFTAGFGIGHILQKEFVEVRKFGINLVEMMETTSIKMRGEWDKFLEQMKGGWKSVVKEIARAFLTIIPTVFYRSLETIGSSLDAVGIDFGKTLENHALASLGNAQSAADKWLNSLVDTSGTDNEVSDIEKRVQEQLDSARKIFEEMKKNLYDTKEDLPGEEDGKQDGARYGKAFEQSLKEIDFYQRGVNAGKSLGEGLLTQLGNIRDALAEESADSLEDRLKLIEAEFKDFVEGLDTFNTEGDQAIVEIQKKAQEELGRIRENQNLSEKARRREIASIEKRAAMEVAKIRESQEALAGAPQAVQQLIELRKEKERQKYIDEQIQDTQNRITGIEQERADKLAKVNELAELGLIGTEEQGKRIAQINDEMIAKMQEAIGKARELAEETGNADLSSFLDQYDNFETVERRRAAVERLENLEGEINDRLNTRQSRIESINTLMEAGVTKQAEGRQEIQNILNTSQPVLEKMVKDGIKLAEALGDPKMVANFKALQAEMQGANEEVFNGVQMSHDFASGFANAFDQFIMGTKSASEAFRQFISDFLRQIAKAIIQQLILNAISGAFGGGGSTAGAGTATAGVAHTGGIAGRTGSNRTVDASWFAGAVKYHSGGVAGLKPNEVPTILEKGEEVLTRDDPRHRYNQGSDNQSQGVKIINTIDSSSVISEGLNSPQGQKAIVNFIRANKAQVKSVLA